MRDTGRTTRGIRSAPRTVHAFVAGAIFVGGVACADGDPMQADGGAPDAALGSDGGGSDGGMEDLAFGPILGAASDESLKLWLRGEAEQSFQVRYWPSGAPDLAREVWMPEARPERDFASVARLDGLGPDDAYEYEILTPARSWVARGTFRAVPPAASPAVIRFAIAGDVLDGDVPGFRDIAAVDPDFVLMLGDNVYADGAAETVEAYRQRYERVWGGPDFRALFSAVPVFMMWDDHEIVDNYWNGKNDAVYAFARPLYDTYQGMHNPDPLVEGEIYYTFSTAEVGFFVLDTRSHRSNNADPDGPEKSMLGSEQKAALLAWLADDASRVHVIVSSVLLHRATTTGSDSWQSFASERGEILEAIAAAGTRNVMVVSGDQHWAAVLRTDSPGSDPYSVYEFEATPLDFTLRGAPSSLDDTVIGLENTHQAFGVIDVDTTVEPPRVAYTLCAVGEPCDPHREPEPPVGRAASVPYSLSFVGGQRGLEIAATSGP